MCLDTTRKPQLHKQRNTPRRHKIQRLLPFERLWPVKPKLHQVLAKSNECGICFMMCFQGPRNCIFPDVCLIRYFCWFLVFRTHVLLLNFFVLSPWYNTGLHISLLSNFWDMFLLPFCPFHPLGGLISFFPLLQRNIFLSFVLFSFLVLFSSLVFAFFFIVIVAWGRS